MFALDLNMDHDLILSKLLPTISILIGADLQNPKNKKNLVCTNFSCGCERLRNLSDGFLALRCILKEPALPPCLHLFFNN